MTLGKPWIRKFFDRYDNGSKLLWEVEEAEQNFHLLARGKETRLGVLGKEPQALVGLFSPWLWVTAPNHAQRHFKAEQEGYFRLAAEILLKFYLLEEAAIRDSFSFAKYGSILARFQHSTPGPGELFTEEKEWLIRMRKICEETGQEFVLTNEQDRWDSWTSEQKDEPL
jgi:hypothetical protein